MCRRRLKHRRETPARARPCLLLLAAAQRCDQQHRGQDRADHRGIEAEQAHHLGPVPA
jgi:hypothetical protein